MPPPSDQRPKLSAPAAAQKQHAKLRRDRSWPQLPGFMAGKKTGREAKPPAKVIHTAAAPTVERKYKEPELWKQQEHPGGQVSHRRQRWRDVYDKHLTDAERLSADLLERAWEIASRVTITSARAYDGMPFTGHSPNGEGHVFRSHRDREDIALFALACEFMFKIDDRAWFYLEVFVLHEPDERTGRVPSAAEVGAEESAYRSTDLAQAVTVGLGKAALRLWAGCLRLALQERQKQRVRQRAAMEKHIEAHASREKARTARRLASG